MLGLLLLPLGAASAQQVVAPQRSWAFPAGSPSQLTMLDDNTAIVLNSWSRGDGLLVFDMRGDVPRFHQGILAHGYSFQGTVAGEHLYAANWFSMSVTGLARGQAPAGRLELKRNILFHFPQGSLSIIASAGRWLYLGDRVHGLRIFDISQPGAPVLSAWQPELGKVQRMLASPSRVVVITRDGQAHIGCPPEAMDQPAAFYALMPLKGAAVLVDDVLYHTAQGHTRWYKLPAQAFDTPLEPAGDLPGHQLLCEASQNRLLLKTTDNQLALMDVSDPTAPRLLRRIQMKQPLPPGDYLMRGGRLLVLDKKNTTLSQWDIAGHEARLVGMTPIMRNSGTVEALSDGRLLLQYSQGNQTTLLSLHHQDNSDALLSMRLEMPMPPRTGYRQFSQHRAAAMALLDDQYLLTGDGLLDVSSAAAAKVIHAPTRAAASIRVEDGVAFLAQHDRMTMLGLHHLPQLQTLGVYQPAAAKPHLVDVVPHGQYAYVLDYQGEKTTLATLDVTDKANPALLNTLTLPDALAMARQGDRLYAATGNNRARPALVYVLDLSNPAQPQLLQSHENLIQGDCYRARAWQGRLFLVDDARGIVELDLTNPDHPAPARLYTGDSAYQPVYTDFIIRDNTLTGLRFRSVETWELTP